MTSVTFAAPLNVRVASGALPEGFSFHHPEENDEVLAEKALEARARRVAKAAGFIAMKSRVRTYCTNFQGGFQICDGYSGTPVEGWYYELSAQDVIDFIGNLPD